MKPINNQKFNILVVDDVPKNIQVLETLLDQKGYQVAIAKDGQEALSIIGSNQFDLILLDIIMPKMDGFEVCRRLKNHQQTKDIPVIFLTGRTETDAIIKGFEMGAVDYVSKPVDSRELLARVKTQLELREKTRQLATMNHVLERKVKERTEQLVEANRRLARLDKAKTNFLALISHEMQTPLTHLSLIIQVMRESLKSPKQLKYFDIIKESAERLLRFTEIALLITTIQADKYEMNVESISLENIIDSSIDKHNERAKRKTIQIIKNPSHVNLIISGDSKLISKSIDLLLENAIKHSPPNETVLIELYSEKNNISVEIKDEGPGFSKGAWEQMFEFFSIDDLLHHKEGLGLGLATVKLIADLHNATIDIWNRNEGGASVRLTFFENQLNNTDD